MSLPMLAPGERMPLAVTAPSTTPVPPSVAPGATVTGLPAAVEPVTSSFPAEIVVAPV